VIRASLAAFLVCAPATGFAACAVDQVDLKGDFGQARFTVEVADEPAERSQGLMFVEAMPRSSGMLFLYEAPQRAVFWMKNTLIPLDMIFLDSTGRITHIHENAVPLDETGIDGGTGVLAVLEINGGLSRQLGLAVGDVLRHPGLDQDGAAWPCD
jgi:uncharacterized membrane protein (UPF0127 family)